MEGDLKEDSEVFQARGLSGLQTGSWSPRVHQKWTLPHSSSPPTEQLRLHSFALQSIRLSEISFEMN